MEISSVASQALALRENTTNAQLGVVALKHAADSQQKLAEMLAKNARDVPPPAETREGGFSTYA